MAQAAVTAQIHQPLDRHADLATQVAFDHEFRDFGAQTLDFRLAQITDLGDRSHLGGGANLLRPGTADAENALKPYPDMFLGGKVDTGTDRKSTRLNSSH